LSENTVNKNDVLDPAAANAYYEGAIATLAALKDAS